MKSLDVSKSTLINEDYLFENLAEIPNLKRLNASYCNIRSIPKLEKTLSFEYLNLAGNLLTSLPVGLKVANLDISANSYLEIDKTLDVLANYKELEQLNLAYNKWESLPANCG